MPGDSTIIAGIEVPSTSPFFLAIVGVHFLLGSRVRDLWRGCNAKSEAPRPSSDVRENIFWCLCALFAPATVYP